MHSNKSYKGFQEFKKFAHNIFNSYFVSHFCLFWVKVAYKNMFYSIMTTNSGKNDFEDIMAI